MVDNENAWDLSLRIMIFQLPAFDNHASASGICFGRRIFLFGKKVFC